MKRTIAFTLFLTVVLSTMFPTTAYAAKAECGKHNYKRSYAGKKFDSDICVNCGFENVHKTPYELPFITRNDGIVTREEPRKSAAVVNKHKKSETKLRVTGRLRNECNNLWLELSDGSYTFADNVAFDFDAMTTEAISSVDAFASPGGCNMTYSAKDGLMTKCFPTILGKYGSMFYHFQPKGKYDLKQAKILGLKTYDYYVYFNGSLLDERHTGEELGNILYGYVSESEGISLEDTIRYAGLADNPDEILDAFACFFLNDLSRCDDEDDIEMIKLGWNHFYVHNSGGGGGGRGGRGF